LNAYIDADLREPDDILGHPDLHKTLDMTRPVALILACVLHFIRDDEDPQGVVDRLVAALPAGSYVVASHATWEYLPADAIEKLVAANPDGRFVARTGTQLGALLSGLELVEPGVVSISSWRAEKAPQPRPAPRDVACFGAVGRVR